MTILAPNTETEACLAIGEAAAARTPLAIEGGGTKRDIGRPAQTERTLSSRGLAGITLHEPAELVVSARAGTPLAAVEAALAEAGQQLTFEPPDYRALLGSGGEPTIGAVAAANLSGPRRVQAGAARDSLIGVRLVNGRGEAVKSGGRVMKNVTGLDLVKLMGGSWGTLGFLTEVTFKVLPRPERAATLAFRRLGDAAASAALAAALSSPFEAAAASHLPAGIGADDARTLIRLEGFSSSVDYRFGELRRLLKAYGQAELVDGEASASLWRSVRDVLPFAEDDRREAVWRVSTAPTKGHEVAADVSRSIGCRVFYDWGGGLVWIACAADGDAGAGAIRAAVSRAGGHATLVRAPAEIRAAIDVFEPQPEPLRRLLAGIKAAFDPAGILNPGRMYAGL